MSESRVPIHPYAQLFPPLSSAEFDVLCGAILVRGLLEDIVIHEGKILCIATVIFPHPATVIFLQ